VVQGLQSGSSGSAGCELRTRLVREFINRVGEILLASRGRTQGKMIGFDDFEPSQKARVMINRCGHDRYRGQTKQGR